MFKTVSIYTHTHTQCTTNDDHNSGVSETIGTKMFQLMTNRNTHSTFKGGILHEK